MSEAEPWSYHVDGSPVYSLADIIAEAVRHHPGGDRVHRGGPDGLVSEAELIAWTRDRLAHFKCPAGVSFAASLARTASGKLQKQAIRASLSSVAVQ
jgi:acyl-CoA synthetase (AMP-forming)/AMP-acid ligase II